MKKKFLIPTVIIAGVLLFKINTPVEKKAEIQEAKTIVQYVASGKVFHLGFDEGINSKLVNLENLYVIDSENRKVDIMIKKLNNKEIEIAPPVNGYSLGITYKLHINRDLDLENVGNKTVPKEYVIDFKVTDI